MIRDLIYPDDARKVIDSLHRGLQYDAAVGLLGNTCSEAPLKGDGPDFSTGIRYGGLEEDKAARRDAKGLLPRFALISMVSRFERHAQLLLLQRRVLEELGRSGKKMVPERMWDILRKVNKEAREGPVKVCSEMVVEHPSPALVDRMKWLSGIYKIRNCLAHRLGNVEMVDVKRRGTSIDDIQEGDKLRAVWLRVKASVGGGEIPSFPHQVSGPSEVLVGFEGYEREWGIGEQIEITPLECQAIAMSLSLLGNQLLADFEQEMDNLLGSS
jgi:hypothetical protein